MTAGRDAGRTLYPRVAGERGLTVEDLWAIPRVGAVVPSPDGRQLAVVVKLFDMATNAGRSRIHLLPSDGGEGRAFTSAATDSHSPAFSPDGKRLAFIRKLADKEKGQLHVMPVDGGDAERWSDLPLGVIDPLWLPDGSGILCLSKLLVGHLTPEATRVELERRDKDPVKAIVTEERLYRFWDDWLAGGAVPHVFLCQPGVSKPLDLTPDSTLWLGLMDHEGVYDVAPDSREVAFTGYFVEGAKEYLRSAVYTVALTGGEPRPLTLDHANRAFDPRYAPDGRSLVYGVTQDPHFYADRVQLFRLGRADGQREELGSEWELSPDAWTFARDGRLWLTAEADGRSCLFELTSGGKPVQRTHDGSIAGVRSGPDGRAFFSWQSLQRPAEVGSVEPSAGEPRLLSRFTSQALAGIRLGEVRELRVSGGGGAEIQTYVVLPPEHREGQPCPLVHVIHGGPHGITPDAFHPRWNAQLFAAPGYAVACVNFQGSTSRGQDFARRIRGAWGKLPLEDVLAATDALVAAGLVDPDRMAITGGSYGGYLVAWLATQSERFRCAVNHAGVFDLLAQYASDVTQGRSDAFGGEPWDGLDAIDRFNPVRETAGLNTPMLVVHGEKDYRVPVTQGLACYNILKAKGVPARLVYYPDENHWVLKPQNSRLWYREVHAWLARFLVAAPA